MADSGDNELLRKYTQGVEDAFAELVRRHINLVYSSALRHVGIAAHAEEITQAVFIILSRKAAALRPDTILDAWLYETTRLTALSFMRGERRRQRREQEAYMQSTIQEPETVPVWNQLVPLLDEAMARLNKKDREAIVLRFFKEKNLNEVAAAMRVTEAAAQSRVHRAVGKLQQFFLKRGIHSTAAAITEAISAGSTQVAPAALIQTTTAIALAKGAAAPTSTLTLIKGALKIMAWTKAKTAVVVAAAVLLVGGATSVTVEQVISHRDEAWQQSTDNSILATVKPQTRILPALKSRNAGVDWWGGAGGKWIGIGVSSSEIVQAAYDATIGRMIISVPMPQGKYDFICSMPSNQQELLQQAVKGRFGLVAQHVNIETNVLTLVLRRRDMPGLNPTSDPSVESCSRTPDTIQCVYKPMSKLVEFLENALGTPVVDQTGLSGRFDMYLHWDSTPDGLKRALTQQLGLELVPGHEPVDYVIVEKAN